MPAVNPRGVKVDGVWCVNPSGEASWWSKFLGIALATAVGLGRGVGVDGTMCSHSACKGHRGVQLDGARCLATTGQANRGSKWMVVRCLGAAGPANWGSRLLGSALATAVATGRGVKVDGTMCWPGACRSHRGVKVDGAMCLYVA